MISAAQIETVLQQQVGAKAKDAPRVSGSMESHYAPSTKTRLLAARQIPDYLQTLSADDMPVAVVVLRDLQLQNAMILVKKCRTRQNHTPMIYIMFYANSIKSS
jgi:hypothetical protein